MENLWSARDDLICLHPGWPALIGRAAVLDSWRSILGNPSQGQVSVFKASAHPLSEDSVLVVCYEQAGDTVMVASNVFCRESERMRMVSHQAGFCGQPPAAD